MWPAMAWVVVFMIAPLGFMFVFSFWRYSQFELYPDFTLDNYIALFDSAVYVNVLVRTVLIATFTTITTIALAYPLVIFLHRQDRRVAVFIIALVVVPFWVNTLVRNYAFFSLLQREGLINFVLGKLGFVPAEILFTTQAVLLVSVYLFLPFAIISLYASVEKISPSLLEAAEDLGAGSWQTFRRVLFPLSWSGLQVAVFFVFIPSLGLFLTPAMIGGGRTTMLSNLVVPLMAQTRNFAAGSAFVFVMLAIVLVLVMLLGRRMNLESLYAGGAGAASSRRSGKKRSGWLMAYTALILVFLYTPISLIVLFSFDKNFVAGFPLQGFTMQWYQDALKNPVLIRALKNSIYIASLASVITVAIAAPAAYAVARFRFVGRELFRALVLIPVVVPDIVLAAGILILLVRLDVSLSLLTIVAGHVTYALPFVFFVVLAQQYGSSAALEEAAHDLGANSLQKFRYVTLPLMLPALLVGGILVFTISLNDFMITFMLTGTTSTLPLFMWALLRGAFSPELNAVATVLTAATLVILVSPILVSMYLQRRERRSIQKAGEPGELGVGHVNR